MKAGFVLVAITKLIAMTCLMIFKEQTFPSLTDGRKFLPRKQLLLHLVEAPPKDDGILGLSSEDLEDDDFNPGDPDKDESIKTESSNSDFTSDSEDFSFIVDTDRLQGGELIKISCACESVEIRRFSELRSRLEDVTARFLRDGVKPAKRMITNLIDMEMDYINSSHPNFIGGTKAVDMAN
ncbi:hypothetical protein FXO37_18952 [Capsicum annuum]|nr:hypothetical protein FXO37_18952 [Capsicum annuum]